jgi:signal transduction histidine kinase
MGGRLVWSRMRRVADWSLRTRLAMMLLAPTLVAVVFSTDQVGAELALAGQAAALGDRVAAIDKALAAVHELQRERDLTASGGPGLAEERKRVDAAVSALDAEFAGHPELAARDGQIAQVRRQLGTLSALRQGADRGADGRLAAVNDFAAVIDPLLDLTAVTEDQADDETVRRTSGALSYLGQAIEQIRSQEVVLAQAAAANVLTPQMLSALRTAEARVDDAVSHLHGTFSPDQQAAFNATVDGATWAKREQVEDQTLALTQAASVPGAQIRDWLWASQPVVDQLTRFEATLSGSLRDAVGQLGVSAEAGSLRDAALAIGALLIGLVLALRFAGSMVGPLWTLRRRALEVASRELPEAIDRFARSPATVVEVLPAPVEVSTDEEIGQVARAFDEVHTSALRLAAEQAALRHSVNEIFVSLSRRTQSLVDRQLRMIDDMEAQELDPDQLERLFHLDHLATRMRRNSENLLVLAGSTPRRATSQPVALVDMLRAALSEIEDYTRVLLKPAPDLAVLGAAVSDVVHLLAELLDNATTYSSPQTRVTVVCTQRENGDLCVCVADEGIGMSSAECEEMNRQLAMAAPIEAALSQRMGLFVVSRLAARRGVTVRLRANVGAGTVADVILPADILCPAEPVPPLGVTATMPQAAPPRRTPAAALMTQARDQFAENEATGRIDPPTRPADAPRASWRAGGAVQDSQTLVGPVLPSGLPVRLRAGETVDDGPGQPQLAPNRPIEEPAEVTPIFDEIAPVWFRDPTAISPPRTADDSWPTRLDEVWHAGDRLDQPETGGHTAAGLPRRVRGAMLVQGSVRAVADKPQPPRPTGAELKSRMSSYQSGMRRGRVEYPSCDGTSRRSTS